MLLPVRNIFKDLKIIIYMDKTQTSPFRVQLMHRNV
jgi:hypothetical protein